MFVPLRSHQKPFGALVAIRALGEPGFDEREVELVEGFADVTAVAYEYASVHRELRRLAVEKGRNPGSISVSIFWAPADRAVLDGYEKLGVERVILALPTAGREEVLPILDAHARLIQ